MVLIYSCTQAIHDEIHARYAAKRTEKIEAREKAANKAKQAALKISNDREVDGKSTPLVACFFITLCKLQ